MWSQNFINAVIGKISGNALTYYDPTSTEAISGQGVSQALQNSKMYNKFEVVRHYGQQTDIFPEVYLGGWYQFADKFAGTLIDLIFVPMLGVGNHTVKGSILLAADDNGQYTPTLIGTVETIDSESCVVIFDDGTNKVGAYVYTADDTVYLAFKGTGPDVSTMSPFIGYRMSSTM